MKPFFKNPQITMQFKKPDRNCKMLIPTRSWTTPFTVSHNLSQHFDPNKEGDNMVGKHKASGTDH